MDRKTFREQQWIKQENAIIRTILIDQFIEHIQNILYDREHPGERCVESTASAMPAVAQGQINHGLGTGVTHL